MQPSLFTDPALNAWAAANGYNAAGPYPAVITDGEEIIGGSPVLLYLRDTWNFPLQLQVFYGAGPWYVEIETISTDNRIFDPTIVNYDDSGQVVSVGAWRYDYDSDGNPIWHPVTQETVRGSAANVYQYAYSMTHPIYVPGVSNWVAFRPILPVIAAVVAAVLTEGATSEEVPVALGAGEVAADATIANTGLIYPVAEEVAAPALVDSVVVDSAVAAPAAITPAGEAIAAPITGAQLTAAVTTASRAVGVVATINAVVNPPKRPLPAAPVPVSQPAIVPGQFAAPAAPVFPMVPILGVLALALSF